MLRRKHSGEKALIATADKLGNGAVFKRLGFLAEMVRGADMIVDACRTYLSSGNAKLDYAIPCPRLVTRWRLWIPTNWMKAMIDRAEILRLAGELSLRPAVVEKDYVLG